MVGRVSVVPAIKSQVCKLFDQDTKCAVLNIYNLNIISHNTLSASIQVPGLSQVSSQFGLENNDIG